MTERDKKLQEFTAYFAENYPGPQTIITDPYWHAPRIFRALERILAIPETAVSEERKYINWSCLGNAKPAQGSEKPPECPDGWTMVRTGFYNNLLGIAGKKENK